MHELSIAQGLVEVACEALARCEPAPARVASLRVRIGALAGVVPDALEFCYGLSVEGYAAGRFPAGDRTSARGGFLPAMPGEPHPRR